MVLKDNTENRNKGLIGTNTTSCRSKTPLTLWWKGVVTFEYKRECRRRRPHAIDHWLPTNEEERATRPTWRCLTEDSCTDLARSWTIPIWVRVQKTRWQAKLGSEYKKGFNNSDWSCGRGGPFPVLQADLAIIEVPDYCKVCLEYRK